MSIQQATGAGGVSVRAAMGVAAVAVAVAAAAARKGICEISFGR